MKEYKINKYALFAYVSNIQIFNLTFVRPPMWYFAFENTMYILFKEHTLDNLSSFVRSTSAARTNFLLTYLSNISIHTAPAAAISKQIPFTGVRQSSVVSRPSYYVIRSSCGSRLGSVARSCHSVVVLWWSGSAALPPRFQPKTRNFGYRNRIYTRTRYFSSKDDRTLHVIVTYIVKVKTRVRKIRKIACGKFLENQKNIKGYSPIDANIKSKARTTFYI